MKSRVGFGFLFCGLTGALMCFLLCAYNSSQHSCAISKVEETYDMGSYKVHIVDMGICRYNGFYDGRDIYINSRLGKWGRYQTYVHERCHMLLREHISKAYKGADEETFCEEMAMLVVGGDEFVEKVINVSR